MPAQGSTHSCPDSEWRGLKRRKRRLRGVIEMFLQRYLDDIRVKTAGMTAREKISYVFTYYFFSLCGFMDSETEDRNLRVCLSIRR